MKLCDALRKRINEIMSEKQISLTQLCLNSNITPSTIFDFMNNNTSYPTILTISKLCAGANITLEEFFAKDYFKDFDEIYQ